MTKTLIAVILCLVLSLNVEARKSGGGGSSSRGSSSGSRGSSSYGWQRPSSSHTAPSSSGWSKPSSHSAPSSNTGHSGWSSSPSHTNSQSHSGWNRPASPPSQTNSQSHSGWVSQPHSGNPASSQHSGTGTNTNHPSAGSNIGWSNPNKSPSAPSSSGSHPPTPNQHSGTGTNTNHGSTGTNIGWNVPNKSPSAPSSSGSHPPTPNQHSGTGTNTNHGSTGTNIGWNVPNKSPSAPSSSGSHPPTPTSNQHSGTGTGSAGTNIGWNVPNKSPSSPTHAHTPVVHNTPQKSSVPTGGAVHPNPTNNHPTNPGSNNFWRTPPSQNIGPNGYPVQQTTHHHHYYSGPPKTVNNYSPTTYTSAYGISHQQYPHSNPYGYPAQGLAPGSHSAHYQGQPLFYGGPSAGFGYPAQSNSWGYHNSYGSSSSTLTNILIGAAVGHYATKLLYDVSRPRYSDSWGYSRSGYGYGHGHDDLHRNPSGGNTYYNTNYYYNGATASDKRPSQPNSKPQPDLDTGLIHCVAFDTTTNETLFNPNCTCTVIDKINPDTKEKTQVQMCKTNDGRDVEELVTPASPNLKPIKYQNTDTYAPGAQSPGTYANGEKFYSDKLTKEQELEKRRNEIYERLEKLVNMGSFRAI